MGFEKAFTNQYEDLPQHTKYRFAEIELHLALNNLIQMYYHLDSPKIKATDTLYSMLVPSQVSTPHIRNQFYDMVNKRMFTAPPKNEKIHYLIMYGETYTKIRNTLSASFNTIANMRFGLPNYYPIADFWTPELLQHWNRIRHNLNLWQETLVHKNIKSK